jgi:hypothetical protein
MPKASSKLIERSGPPETWSKAYIVHDDDCHLWHGGKCRCEPDCLVFQNGLPLYITPGRGLSTKLHLRVLAPHAVTEDQPSTDDDGNLTHRPGATA